MGKRTFLNRQFAFYCASVVSVVFIVWITALTAIADEQKQSGSKKQISPKLSLLLQQLERGPSKDETLTLLKKANLTQAEARSLE